MKKTIYVFSNGDIKRKDNTLFFETTEGDKKYFPVEDIREIYFFGEISLNKKSLEFFTQKEIILHFFNHYGYYIGSYYPSEHYNSGYMIIKQALAYEDFNQRITLAKSFVEGAAKNSLKILKYYNRREKKLDNQIQEIENSLTKIKEQQTNNTLMAIEGRIKQFYYQSFSKIIDNKEFTFITRTKRPPQDYINTLISFGNSIIYTMCLSEIYQTHLDPRIGFLHTTNFRRFSLNLDIAEIFKPVISDRTIFHVLNKGIITENDFEKDLKGIILKSAGQRKFLETLEKKLNQTISHSTLKTNISYRRLMRLECYKIEKFLIENIEYKPFVMDW